MADSSQAVLRRFGQGVAWCGVVLGGTMAGTAAVRLGGSSDRGVGAIAAVLSAACEEDVVLLGVLVALAGFLGLRVLRDGTPREPSGCNPSL